MLAGVSADYYIRLEQGRDKHPSDQVLEALSRVLDLDADGLDHLRRLSRPVPARRRRAAARPERVDPGLHRFLDSLTTTPAVILGRRLDVLAANLLMTALHPRFAPGENLVRTLFLDPAARAFYPDWDRVAADTVASLRAAADVEDPALAELVGDLSLRSPDFGTLWARHDVRAKTRGTKRMISPLVGALTLDYETLAPQGTDGQLLIAYHAEPNSPSAAALALLSSAATPTHDQNPATH